MSNGQLVHGLGRATAARVESLARWWSQAQAQARYEILARAIKGDPQAPTLETLRLAIYLAEVEAGEVAQG